MSTRSKSFWYLVSAMVFTACLICANVIAVKMASLGRWIVPAGMLIFPLSYIFGDILVECFGIKKARTVIYLGYLGNLLFVIFTYIAQKWPYPVWWGLQKEYEAILGFTPRLLVASFIAYMIGQLSNAQIMHTMRHGKVLAARTILSTVVGEGLDSLVFTALAFYGVMANPAVITAIFTGWVFKTLIEVLFTPITYAVVKFVNSCEED